jgi:hypothetical protein
MKLFKTSAGFVFAFGFDMVKRVPDPRIICWCDPAGGEWETAVNNMAGWVQVPFDIAPEFIRECGNKIIAYQPGVCAELQYIGTPMVWSIAYLTPDAPCTFQRAA